MVMLMRRRVMAAKIEVTPGTAESLAAGDAAFNVFESTMNPERDFEERIGQGVMSPLPGTLGAKGGTASFKVELSGSGSVGTPTPAWASVFLPAVGMVSTVSNVYHPESKHPESPSANTKTLTIAVYEDGKHKMLRGAMGTAVITFTAGKPVMVEFTFTGIWVAPSDVALLAPDYPSVIPPRFVSAGVTIAAWSPKIAELAIDLGNEVALREDANDPSGFCTAIISTRRIIGTLNPEASLVAENDQDAIWDAGTEQALAIALGGSSANGNTVAIAAPKLQWSNVQEGERNGAVTDELEFQLNRSADAGDDELTITFA